jgi:hypothetical protein
VSTVPETTTALFKLPTHVSVAVAPGSVNEVPHSTCMVAKPITPRVGARVSTTLTVRVAVPVLLAWSLEV